MLFLFFLILVIGFFLGLRIWARPTENGLPQWMGAAFAILCMFVMILTMAAIASAPQ